MVVLRALVVMVLSLLPLTASAKPFLRSRDCGLGAEEPAAAAPTTRVALRTHASSWTRGQTIRGRETVGYVSFTFDDGPSAETTPQILEALARYEVPATFFVVGRRFVGDSELAQNGRQVLGAIVEQGHVVGNHTSQHRNLRKQRSAEARRAIHDNAEALERELGRAIPLFRPPFGAMTRALRAYLKNRGHTLVLWSIDPRDFVRRKRGTLRRRVVEAILKNQGGVVLLHDTKPWTAEEVPGILEDLEAENCRRISDQQKPIVPVSLHYFMRDADGQARPIPPNVQRKTANYVKKLTARCKARD